MKSKKKKRVPPAWARRMRDRMREIRMSMPTLARELGFEGDSAMTERLYKIARGEVDNPRGTLLADIAKVIGMTERQLRYGTDDLSSEDVAALNDQGPDDPGLRRESGIREIDVRAGMGGGGITEGREVVHSGDGVDPLKDEAWRFPARFMREEIRAPESRVIVIETQGDSMAPTLLSGDRVIVDTGHKVPSPDGIYALRDQFGGIIVKRLQTLRGSEKIRIISDNKAHDAEDVGPDQIFIIGRVLWGLKRL